MRWGRLCAAAALIVVGEIVTFLLLRSQGNDLGGDQAHYLIAAQALAHGSVHPGPWYQRDFLAHYVYNWPVGATVSNLHVVQTYPGPHGSVFAHGLGLPLLLAPFVAVGNVPLGLLGLFAIVALGAVCIHQRGSRVARLGRSGRIVFALALGAPALWVASTQVYPDLISGVLLAAALVEVALVERERVLSPFSAAVVAGALAAEPWLQIKNLLPALCVAAAAAVVIVRLGGSRRTLVVMGAVVLAGWGLLLGYNLFFYGHPEGLPQPHPTFTGTSVTRVLALLFDRDQGLLVQVPTILLGVLGLWAARRTVPWAVGATVAGSVLMILVNGTFTTDVPFGGAALAGRFEWTVAPMLLAWAPFLLVAVERHRARILGVAAGVGAVWVAQAVPLFEGTHQYVNAMIAPFAPWDPTLYPGWWPGLGGALPTFLAPGLHDAATWSHLLVELLMAGAITFVLQTLTRPGPLRAGPVAGIAGALCALALVVAVVAPPRDEPQSSLSLVRSRHRLALDDGRARRGLRSRRVGRRRPGVLSSGADLRRHRRFSAGNGFVGRRPVRTQCDVGLVHPGTPHGRSPALGHASALGSLHGTSRPRRAPARGGASDQLGQFGRSRDRRPRHLDTKGQLVDHDEPHVGHRPPPHAAASQRLRRHDAHVDEGLVRLSTMAPDEAR